MVLDIRIKTPKLTCAKCKAAFKTVAEMAGHKCFNYACDDRVKVPLQGYDSDWNQTEEQWQWEKEKRRIQKMRDASSKPRCHDDSDYGDNNNLCLDWWREQC